jgi:peptide/nickel transport system permease protein
VTRFIVRRVLASVLVMLGVLIVTFVFARLAPSDPARMWAGPRASPEQIAKVTKDLGLDRPMVVQLVDYIRDFVSGDWDRSLVTKRPVAADVALYAPLTLELVIVAMLLSLVIGVPLGVLSANSKDRWLDHGSRVLAVGLVSIPTFFFALALQFALSGRIDLLPLGGTGSYAIQYSDPIQRITGFPIIDALVKGNFTAWGDHIVHMILPSIALMAMCLGTIQRLTRAAMVEVLNEDYIVAARSYGLSENIVLWRYSLKNSLGPIATVTALTFASTLVCTFLVESIFSWGGIGTYMARAAADMDYPVILAVTVLSALSYVVLNTVADIVIALDPRVRIRD